MPRSKVIRFVDVKLDFNQTVDLVGSNLKSTGPKCHVSSQASLSSAVGSLIVGHLHLLVEHAEHGVQNLCKAAMDLYMDLYIGEWIQRG